MKLLNVIEIKGEIEVLTGLRVGGSGDIIEIGGNDNPIIRNPQNNEPYIPGSSIKGKMRSLLEWYTANISSNGEPHSCDKEECVICRTFGRGAKDSGKAKSGPTRLVVRDAYLTDESKQTLDKLRKTIGSDTELKSENKINRLDSSANPRNVERVPAGTKFVFNMSYKIMDINDTGKTDKENFEMVLKGLKLLTVDGIGGGISRGNGQVKFIIKVDGVEKNIEDIKLA